jgi:hypothetical protein
MLGMIALLLAAAAFRNLNVGVETPRRVFQVLNLFPFARAPFLCVPMDFDLAEEAPYVHAHKNRFFFVIVTATTTARIRMSRGFTVPDEMTNRREARLTAGVMLHTQTHYSLRFS